MCFPMAAGLKKPETVPERVLKEQLAATTRRIQWSYAIFWSISTKQPGLLEWSDGYYNGDIKTRKTTHAMELKADQIGLQRSEQLRELYLSLSAGDSIQQTRRPSVSLSPEDLTESEWYYLVCMSFTFNPGQGLPGRTVANGQPIWLSNAHFADSKIFSRSLLAKSASMQTVVCFPFMGGVLELGTSELISEDPILLQQVTTSFWEIPQPVCCEQSLSSPYKAEEDRDHGSPNLTDEILDAIPEKPFALGNNQKQSEACSNSVPVTLHSYNPSRETDLSKGYVDEMLENFDNELRKGSPDFSSNECYPNQHIDDSIVVEELNDTSQIQNWQFMDDDFTNGLHGSLNSSDCLCPPLADLQRIISSPKGERIKDHFLHDPQESSHTELSLLGFGTDGSHYSKTLSAIFGNSHCASTMPCFPNSSRTSSFTIWRRGLDVTRPCTGTPQKLLKKILFDVAWMHGGSGSPSKQNSLKIRIYKPEGDGIGASHVLSERRRREKLNDKFLVLRSLIPSLSKCDKASILGDAIEYLKELERRVEELESCIELPEFEAKARRKYLDVAERISDNCGSNEISNGRNPISNKRKASDINDEDEHNRNLSKDSLADVNVTIYEKEVLIEIRCPWRSCLLVGVLEAISSLHLDAHTVQSSTVDGILRLTIKSKFMGAVIASSGMVKQGLQKVIGKR